MSATGPGWRPGVLEALHAHAREATTGAVAGVLVGRLPARDVPMEIVAIVPTVLAHEQGRRPPLDGAAWARVHEAMGRHYLGADVVGWYVSRPGVGTAPAYEDVSAHAQWFAPPRVLFVLDPVSASGALYVTAEGHLRLLHNGPLAIDTAVHAIAAAPDAWPIAPTTALAGIGVVLGLLVWLLTGADAGILAASNGGVPVPGPV